MGTLPRAVHSTVLAPGFLTTNTTMFQEEPSSVVEAGCLEQVSLSRSPEVAPMLLPRVAFSVNVCGCTSGLTQACWVL